MHNSGQQRLFHQQPDQTADGNACERGHTRNDVGGSHRDDDLNNML